MSYWAYRFWSLNSMVISLTMKTVISETLQWRHNGRDSVSNHQPHDCLLNRLFRRRSEKTSKLRVTGVVRGIQRGSVNSPHKWPVKRKMFPFDDVITKQWTSMGKRITVIRTQTPKQAKQGMLYAVSCSIASSNICKAASWLMLHIYPWGQIRV